jgi:hypothetical protein
LLTKEGELVIDVTAHIGAQIVYPRVDVADSGVVEQGSAEDGEDRHHER